MKKGNMKHAAYSVRRATCNIQQRGFAQEEEKRRDEQRLRTLEADEKRARRLAQEKEQKRLEAALVKQKAEEEEAAKQVHYVSTD